MIDNNQNNKKSIQDYVRENDSLHISLISTQQELFESERYVAYLVKEIFNRDNKTEKEKDVQEKYISSLEKRLSQIERERFNLEIKNERFSHIFGKIYLKT